MGERFVSLSIDSKFCLFRRMDEMNWTNGVAVAGVVAAAGMCFGQSLPVVDGKLKSEYGQILWANSTPTGFGNATAPTAPPCDPIGAGIQIGLDNTNRAGITGGFPPLAIASGSPDAIAAAAVESGYVFKLPLSSLGLDVSSGGNNLPATVSIRIAGLITNDNYSTASNQYIGGIGALAGAGAFPNNYPNPRVVDLTAVPGNQFIEVSIARTALQALANGTAPTLDGRRDGANGTFFGSPLFVQDVQTNFGNATTANTGAETRFRCASGSEIDAVYANYGRDAAGELALFVFVAGNTESNFNKLVLFVDSRAGGQNQLLDTNATQTGTFGSITFGGANAFGGTGAGANPGLKFDAGFTADYFLAVNVGGTPADPSMFADFQRLRTSATDAGSARFIGATTAGTNSGIITASDPCPPFVPPNVQDVANGSEINGVYMTVCGNDPDPSKRFLYILVTGNLETNGNRLDLFFDVGNVNLNPGSSAGQQRLQTINLPLDFGRLNRLGGAVTFEFPPGSGTFVTQLGLNFSNGFAADYTVSVANINSGADHELQAWAQMIKEFGPASDGGAPPAFLEYGSFRFAKKATMNPLNFDGLGCIRFAANACAPANGEGSIWNPTSIPGIDIQRDPSGIGNQLTAGVNEPYSSYAPRLISANVFNPLGAGPNPPNGNLAVPGLLQFSLNNSNSSGVTGTDAARARQAATGMELRIRLDELGWAPSGVPNAPNKLRVAGFIVSQDHSVVSNQVIGGTLPASFATSNINEPRLVDFSDVPFNTSPTPYYIEIDPLATTCVSVAMGACCFSDDYCALMSSAQCSGAGSAGGTYRGNGTTCTPTVCGAVSTEVCCRGSTCTIVTVGSCTVASGFSAGALPRPGSTCNASGNLVSPCCHADYNKNGQVSGDVPDIFAFLGDWFASSPYAFVGGDGSGTGSPGVPAIFAFLGAWFAGCN